MNWFEALILGLIQGLTEFLPVSSSGHLELGKAILGVQAAETLSFSIAVHGATVLSTIIVFRKDIANLITGVFRFKWNSETDFVAKIIVSMIPVVLVGLLLNDYIENLFTSNVVLVGSMLLVTACLLIFTYFARQRNKDIGYKEAFIIGIAQAIAIIPGISRSGATIATGLLLGTKKENVARFSFLMVIIPIIGANLKDILSGDYTQNNSIGLWPIVIGFAAAFISGLLACSWMIKIVKNGKLIYFGIYCFIVAIVAIAIHLLGQS
jgi:undecaprenyl-diphosphatase